MITILEYLDEEGLQCTHTAFSNAAIDKSKVKEYIEDALESSSMERKYPYITLTVYSDDGSSYIDGDVFKTSISAFEWWEQL